MKKIDLHLHTIPSISDSHFDFSLLTLQNYVSHSGIDCIAITNHNLFDLSQFEEISKALSICVFPGIEINLETGHLLLISDKDNLTEFEDRCKQVQSLITSATDSISVEKLKEIFPDMDKYLLIPHYDKKPIIKPETIEKLKANISAGEVASIRKFKSCIQNKDQLVPVLFSDMRFFEGIESFSTRQTYIDLDEISLRGIKSCLFDKNKVFLSADDGNEVFKATDDGLTLSTGLNIVIGERSSGKTYTLDKLSAAFENVKYIEQFSLLQNDGEKFNKLTGIRHSAVSESFLKEFREVVEDVSNIDLKQNDIELEKYITTLLKFANENEKLDAYSKAALFGENLFVLTNLDNLKRLIESVTVLIDNVEFREIIDRNLPLQNLKSLAVELMTKYIDTQELNLKRNWVNTVINNIKAELHSRTTSTVPENVDFYKIISNKARVTKFNSIVNSIRVEKEIDSEEIRGFKVCAYTRRFTGASQLKNKSKKAIAFTDAFNSYNKPYDYLCKLKEIDLEPTEFYKYFVDIEFKTLNKHGFTVSGGERSEFNLLHEISDALKHDLLLIDEPESSFDNLFLKSEVNELIKDISKEIPVIVVTHNSTVGASIHPDYVIYTRKIIENNAVKYQVFSGFPSDKQLKGTDGSTINNLNVMLNCLEAGEEAYDNRRTKTYEILKD
jgi:hypothetical protein